MLPQQNHWALNALEVLVRLLVAVLALMMAAYAVFLTDGGTSADFLCATVMSYTMQALALSMVIRSKRLLGLTVAIIVYDGLIHWMFLEKGERTDFKLTTYKVLLIVGILLLVVLFFARPVHRLFYPCTSNDEPVQTTTDDAAMEYQEMGQDVDDANVTSSQV